MAGFTPVEEVERISMAPRETAEKVIRDFFREARVGDHCITMLLVGLVEEVELMDGQKEEEEEEEEEEGTLGEAVEMVIVIPVGVGVALTTMETTRTMRVVMVRLVMVR